MNAIENIVNEFQGELRVSSEAIAAGLGAEHRSVLQLIGTHEESLERFGPLAFEMRPLPGGGNPVRVAHLSEPQVTLLMTFMRNYAPVVAFKVAVVEEFYRMRQALTVQQHALPQTFSEALRELASTVDKNMELEQKIIADEPKVEYVDRFVGQTSDAVTVDVFASQFGSTGPKVRELLVAKGLAARKFMGERWSNSEQRMVDEYEWRARQGRPTSEWFKLLPQHNAPRFHNGQVRQTMYVRQFHVQELAAKLGLEGVGA